MAMTETLQIDLSDIEIADVEVLAHSGARAMPEFAASSGTYCCAPNACSCTTTTSPSPTIAASEF